ncbi:TIGR03936 family radical SAM-associated protein [Acetivibrio straminisolvens]|uniref:TIGR03936 family radical SAM-associated protein n=1 Tax=Acetivibrio straminisolvens TaxID=253314 RepID=UPI001566738A|nr:TIGR03936 family radical SAM-associated protein [Acetivibrio straminisolvens]
MLSSIRVRFVRGEEVKYISHLDLMKMFERALRRSKIPIAYSQGFNPHPHMVFGLPLSVGVTSESEYADFELETDIDSGEFTQRLNQNLPKGIEVVDAKKNNTTSNIMAQVAGASYEVLVLADSKIGIEDLKYKLDEFLKNEQIFVEKESKGKIKKIDIRPMIYNADVNSAGNAPISEDPQANITENRCKNPWILRYVEILEAEDDLFKQSNESAVFCFSMLLAAGSMANLKPEFVITAFGRRSGISFDILKIHRSGLFTGSKEKLTDPLGGHVLLSI